MLRLEHPRDLIMIGAIFGVAAFVWAGWAQEAPPDHWIWRVVLTVTLVAGLALAGLSIPLAVRNWGTPTAIDPGSRAFRVYIVVVVVEVVIAAAAGFLAIGAGRSDLVAPLILAVVGIHFVALAFVFAQPVLHLSAALLVVVAAVAVLIPESIAAPSFWCGLLGAPVFIAIGAWCTIAGRSALRPR
ncbi:hypothetical protein [Microbacterium terregens]|uniref:Uncharacterized protein n=1 Tax=Microbacterium terregens TaxID=69363 RepID=A0ABV5SW45_9MICO